MKFGIWLPLFLFPFRFQVLVLIWEYGMTSYELIKGFLLVAVYLLILRVHISYLLFIGCFFSQNLWWYWDDDQGIRIFLWRTASQNWDPPTWNPFAITWRSVTDLHFAHTFIITHTLPKDSVIVFSLQNACWGIQGSVLPSTNDQVFSAISIHPDYLFNWLSLGLPTLGM